MVCPTPVYILFAKYLELFSIRKSLATVFDDSFSNNKISKLQEYINVSIITLFFKIQVYRKEA